MGQNRFCRVECNSKCNLQGLFISRILLDKLQSRNLSNKRWKSRGYNIMVSLITWNWYCNRCNKNQPLWIQILSALGSSKPKIWVLLLEVSVKNEFKASWTRFFFIFCQNFGKKWRCLKLNSSWYYQNPNLFFEVHDPPLFNRPRNILNNLYSYFLHNSSIVWPFLMIFQCSIVPEVLFILKNHQICPKNLGNNEEN